MKHRVAMLLALSTLTINLHGAETAAPDYLKAPPESLAWFADARFGMFIHWGPVSLLGTEIGWSRQGGDRPVPEWYVWSTELYDNLYRSFYPAEYDPREWVRLAQDAGMKYLVVTTKHHDGFCMFDSALTDYDIMSTPYGRDVIKQLADAAHAAGLKLGFYYSHFDWHHPDYHTENHERYIEYFHGQVRELLTNYGRVDMLWFDLHGTVETCGSHELFRMARELQPHILINNRAGLAGDFDTPEQRVGAFQNDRAWETCMTIAHQWSWKPQDEMKPLDQCLRTLVRCAGGDGNLLFNVGPMPTGRIEPRQAQRLREMGQWLQQYGRTIYGTRGGPFVFDNGAAACTYRGDTLWLHVFHWSHDPIQLPLQDRKVVAARLLSGAGAVACTPAATGYAVTVAPADRDPFNTVIELQLDGPVAETEPVEPVIIWPRTNWARQATVRLVKPADPDVAGDLDVLCDGDRATCWTMPSSATPLTLELDLGQPRPVGGFQLLENDYQITRFNVEAATGPDQWKEVFVGGWGSQNQKLAFDPVTTRRLRLNILATKSAAALAELELISPLVLP